MITRSIAAQNEKKENPRYSLIYDTETTGILPRELPALGRMTEDDLRTYPYITQLSFVIYDLLEKKISMSFNTYIQIPEDVTISQEVFAITGITSEMCAMGMNMVNALNIFYDAYLKCDVVVAHNLSFDSRMIRIECRRHWKELRYYVKMTRMFHYSEKNRANMYCTMMKSMSLCNLTKWPRLAELYSLLFHENIGDSLPLHNSLADILVCLRCYLKVHKEIDISNQEFDTYKIMLGLA